MAEWIEEDHPRIPAGSSEGGQFTEKVSDRAREAAGLDPTPGAVRERYKEFRDSKFEDGEPNSRYETAWLIDEDGEVLFKQDGKTKNVFFDKDQKDMMPGRYLVHNHNIESGLSEADVIYGWNEKLKEIVAVSPGGEYRLAYKNLPEIGLDSWNLVNELKAEIATASEIVWKWRKLDVLQRKITADEANSKHNHEWLKMVIEDTKFGKYLDYRFVLPRGDG